MRQFILNIEPTHDWDILKNENKICIIEDVFFVNGVVTGTVKSGILKKNDKLMLGHLMVFFTKF